MPLSNLTATIIASNKDAHATQSGPFENGKYMGWITLSQKDHYRPLLNTEPIYNTANEAKAAMQQLIDNLRTEKPNA